MTKSRLWESRRAALLLGREPSGILWPEQCELLSKKWILHKSGSANCHIILQIIRVLLIGNLHASFKSSIGKGPYKQTGQAQIGPILPSPSFLHHQAIPLPINDLKKACRSPIVAAPRLQSCSPHWCCMNKPWDQKHIKLSFAMAFSCSLKN